MLPAIGYALRKQPRALFDDPAINALEIDDSLAGFSPPAEVDFLSLRVPQLLLGGSSQANPDRLEAISLVAEQVGAAAISGRLAQALDAAMADGAMVRPPPCTDAALDDCCRQIELLQEHFSPHVFYAENVAFAAESNQELSTADFLYALFKRTGCGWLLDLSTLEASSRAQGFDPHEFVSEVLPAAESVQLHLGSGIADLGQARCADCRARPIAEPVWDLYRHTLRLGSDKITAVFVERDQDPPDLALWRRETHHTRRIAEAVDAEYCCCGR